MTLRGREEIVLGLEYTLVHQGVHIIADRVVQSWLDVVVVWDAISTERRLCWSLFLLGGLDYSWAATRQTEEVFDNWVVRKLYVSFLGQFDFIRRKVEVLNGQLFGCRTGPFGGFESQASLFLDRELFILEMKFCEGFFVVLACLCDANLKFFRAAGVLL